MRRRARAGAWLVPTTGLQAWSLWRTGLGAGRAGRGVVEEEQAEEEEEEEEEFQGQQNSLVESVEDWQLVDEADSAGHGERRKEVEVEEVVRGFGVGSEDLEMMSWGPVLLRDADGTGGRE